MGFEVNKETLQAVVEANKGSKSFYVTEDGHFFTENNKSHAVNHASGRKLRWKQVDPDGNEVSKSKEVISEEEEDYKPVNDSEKTPEQLLAEAKARKDAEEQAKKDAAEQAKKDAEEQAKKDAAEQAKKDAEEQAKKDAAEQAKKDAEEKSKKDAELKAAAGQTPAPKKTPGTRKAGNKTTTKTSDK